MVNNSVHSSIGPITVHSFIGTNRLITVHSFIHATHVCIGGPQSHRTNQGPQFHRTNQGTAKCGFIKEDQSRLKIDPAIVILNFLAFLKTRSSLLSCNFCCGHLAAESIASRYFALRTFDAGH